MHHASHIILFSIFAHTLYTVHCTPELHLCISSVLIIGKKKRNLIPGWTRIPEQRLIRTESGTEQSTGGLAMAEETDEIQLLKDALEEQKTNSAKQMAQMMLMIQKLTSQLPPPARGSSSQNMESVLAKLAKLEESVQKQEKIAATGIDMEKLCLFQMQSSPTSSNQWIRTSLTAMVTRKLICKHMWLRYPCMTWERMQWAKCSSKL